MNARHLAFAGALGAWIALTPAWSHADAEEAGARKRVAPKEALVRRLIEDSASTARIRSSGSAEAAGYLQQAAARHAEALHALASGDYAQADAKLNDAIWLAGRARQLAPDPATRAVEWRVRNASLRMSVHALRASYESQLREIVASGGEGGIADPTLARVDARLDEAQGYAASERLPEAHASLRAAEAELLLAFAQTLGNATLRYGRQFASAADEYAYEMARHASYRELVPVARDQLRPAPPTIAAMDRHVAAASDRLRSAEEAAAAQDYRSALAAVRAATSQLESALAQAGLDMPRAAQP